MMMYRGIARGGPRDSIKLTASLGWDGLITRSDRSYYSGKYVWSFRKFEWIWVGDKPNRRKKPSQIG